MRLNDYDGIICFGGGDINYHNTGHFDMRVMENMAASNRVIWVNSIGMRVPSAGKKSGFSKKIIRKLKSIFKGVVKNGDNFFSVSPLYVPGPIGHAFTKYLLYIQVKLLSRYLGIKKPLLWVVTPTSAEVALMIGKDVVYQRTDKNEEMEDADKAFILKNIDLLREKAMLTVFCSPVLFNEESEKGKKAIFVDHGVSNVFLAKEAYSQPIKLSHGNKAVLFVGAIDEHTFDLSFFRSIVMRMPNYDFFLIGDATFDLSSVEALSNVYVMGRVPQEQVPAYLAGADALAMFWNDSQWIKYCNPIKLKEYMLSGKSIVTTPFANFYDGYSSDGVYVAASDEQFSQHLYEAVASSWNRSLDIKEESWEYKSKSLVDEINSISKG